jgi:hypothetical protein
MLRSSSPPPSALAGFCEPMPTATEIQGSKYLDAKINLEVYLDIKILEIKIPPQGHH